MKITVGSKNPVKVEAVGEILQDYPHLREAKMCSVEPRSDIADQPKSLEETISGAMNRARNSFSDCDYSFGLESGLMAVPNTRTRFMDVCVCAIFDGREYYIGLSSAWEIPKKIAHYIMNEGMNMNDAAAKAGLTKNKNLGSAEGLIGVMSKGRLSRKGYTKEAIRTALIQLEKI